MNYVICQKLITEPQHAIDHKRHVTTLYYSGYVYIKGIGNVKQWSVRSHAEKYNSKRDAARILKLLNDDKAYIKEI